MTPREIAEQLIKRSLPIVGAMKLAAGQGPEWQTWAHVQHHTKSAMVRDGLLTSLPMGEYALTPLGIAVMREIGGGNG